MEPLDDEFFEAAAVLEGRHAVVAIAPVVAPAAAAAPPTLEERLASRAEELGKVVKTQRASHARMARANQRANETNAQLLQSIGMLQSRTRICTHFSKTKNLVRPSTD